MRCGSLATTGLPVAESRPLTTQLFEPGSPISGPGVSSAISRACRRSSSDTARRSPGWLPPPSAAATAAASATGRRDGLVDDRQVETLGHLQVVPRIGRALFVRGFDAEPHDVARERAARADASPNVAARSTSVSAVHGSGVMPVSLNSTGRLLRVLSDERVHAGGVRGEDALAFRVIARPLAIVHRAADTSASAPRDRARRPAARESRPCGLRAAAATSPSATAGPAPSRSPARRTGRRMFCA